MCVFDEFSLVLFLSLWGWMLCPLFPAAQEEESTETEAASFLQRMD